MYGRSGRSPRRVARRSAAGAAALVAGTFLVACTGSTSPGSTSSASSPAATERPPTSRAEYLPGLTANVWEPAAPGPGPLVVLIPGGGWITADPAGLAPLASALADAGMTVVTATYRTSTTDTYFPGPLEDVLCAVAYAAALPTVTGDAPHPIVVVGHSAGANLAALAALTPEAGSPSCPYQPVAPDALVGLAGPYDVAQVPEIGISLFGKAPQEAPTAWVDGNPVHQAGNRVDLPVLLLHGEDDSDVSTSFTTGFADALKAGGHDVTVKLVPGADHSGIYQADVAAQPLITWIDALP